MFFYLFPPPKKKYRTLVQLVYKGCQIMTPLFPGKYCNEKCDDDNIEVHLIILISRVLGITCTLLNISKKRRCRSLCYERVYLPLYKVADTPFHIKGTERTRDVNQCCLMLGQFRRRCLLGICFAIIVFYHA